MSVRKSELRRKQILGATLATLRTCGPAGATTAKIAAKANCSKETIYNWFDDREGLFSGLIHTQAELLAQLLDNIRVEECTDFSDLKAEFTSFGAVVLDVFSGDAHVLTNRAAVAAISDSHGLAESINDKLYRQVKQKSLQMIARGIELGNWEIENANQASSDYLGLLLGDRAMPLLLGEGNARPNGSSIVALSSQAFAKFMKIYGAS